ncbi:MAG: hypothetical protein WAK95_05560, partial [Desulfobacterales bacterium]
MPSTTIAVAAGPRAENFWSELDKELWVKRLLIFLVCAWLLVVVVLPLFYLLSKSVTDAEGRFVGLAHFITYFKTPSLSTSLYNSLFVSVITTFFS